MRNAALGRTIYTGCPKKCIHTLNDYNSLKRSFEFHAFMTNLEMSFISSKMEHLPVTIVMWESRVRISKSQFAICESSFATCESKVLLLQNQIFQWHVFIRLREFRVCNVFFLKKNARNSYEIFKYSVRDLRAAILLLSQAMTSLLFVSHVPSKAQTSFPARGCLR